MSLALPAQISRLVVQASWHSSVVRWVRGTAPVTIGPDTYQPLPELEVSPLVLTGGIEDPEAWLLCPDTVSPFREMAKGPHARVSVRIGRVLSLPTPAIDWLWAGEVRQTETRPEGRAGTIKATLWGRKQDFKDVSLGIKCGSRCAWKFGVSPCGADVASVAATITSVSGPDVEFASLPSDTIKGDWPEGRYTRGVVVVEGLRIMVVEHVVGQAKLRLATAPPQIAGYTWVGKTATVFEGCDKTILACKAHGQDANHAAFGLAMPDHNPIIEDADF